MPDLVRRLVDGYWDWVLVEPSGGGGGSLPDWMVATDGDPNTLAIDGVVSVIPTDPTGGVVLRVESGDGSTDEIVVFANFDGDRQFQYEVDGSLKLRAGIGLPDTLFEVGPTGDTLIGGAASTQKFYVNDDEDAFVFVVNTTDKRVRVVNADLTAGSFESQAAGGVFLFDLPITDPGEEGQIWNDGGTLKVSDGP